MQRTGLILASVVVALIVAPSPPIASASSRLVEPLPPSLSAPDLTAGSASGVWDRNDATGPFDFRWLGAIYTDDGDIHLSVSLYEPFERKRLPRRAELSESRLGVTLSAALAGFFIRRNGRIFFRWGDTASSCCARARARMRSPNVISVVFDPCSYAYGEEIDMAQGESLWRRSTIRERDRTRALDFASPECA
jgi:hypothetical protein